MLNARMYKEISKLQTQGANMFVSVEKNHNTEWRSRREKSPDLLFVSIVADTRFKTLGRDHKVINT